MNNKSLFHCELVADEKLTILGTPLLCHYHRDREVMPAGATAVTAWDSLPMRTPESGLSNYTELGSKCDSRWYL